MNKAIKVILTCVIILILINLAEGKMEAIKTIGLTKKI